MKKGWIGCLIMLLLAGCQRSQSLEARLMESEQKVIPISNYHKKGYHYYLAPSIGRFESKRYSNVFSLDGTKFMVDLNLKAYVFKNHEWMIQKPGIERVYLNRSGKEETYRVDQQELKSGHVLVRFESPKIIGFSLCSSSEVVSIVSAMVEIARSVEFNDLLLGLEFKEDAAKQFKSSSLQLFENRIPEEGRIQELFQNGQ